MSESEIKAGDRFLVEVEVVQGSEKADWVCSFGPTGHSVGGPILPSVVLRTGKRIERPLKVGDRVRFKDPIHHDGVDRTIIGIDGDAAWLKCCDMGVSKYRMTSSLSDLERVP